MSPSEVSNEILGRETAFVVWYGGASVIAGTRTHGQFMAFLTAMFMMYQSFKASAGATARILSGITAGGT